LPLFASPVNVFPKLLYLFCLQSAIGIRMCVDCVNLSIHFGNVTDIATL